MNLLSKILFLCIIVSSLFSCNDTKKDNSTAILFPNEDSELAILMREITNETEKVKSQLLNGQQIEFFTKIKDIYTATPTDQHIRENDWFIPMTDQYIFAVQDLLNNPVNSTDQYNTIVQSCINCHNQVCQGPIKRIRKLMIKK